MAFGNKTLNRWQHVPDPEEEHISVSSCSGRLNTVDCLNCIPNIQFHAGARGLKTSFLFIFGAGALAFMILLVFAAHKRRDRVDNNASKALDIVIASLAAINISGLFGLGWIALVVLFYDGVMYEELSICAALFTLLALFTGAGVALAHRSKIRTAIALLIVAAVPTLSAYGLLIYLDTHPIAWR
jgi:hypothetical protein